MTTLLRRMIKSRKGKIGISAILVGNVATILGSIQKINDGLYSLIGFRPLEFFYQNMIILVSIIFLIGYALVFNWLYQREILPKGGPNKMIFATLTLLVVTGTCIANIILLPKRIEPETLLNKEMSKWVDRIFPAQADNGGIRVHALNPSTPTQVWTTAQCLKALLTAQMDIKDHIPAIKKAFNYIEGARQVSTDAPRQDEGWGLLEGNPYSVTEIAGWVTVAYAASLDSKTKIWSDAEVPIIVSRIERDLQHMLSRQESNGGFRPIKQEPPPNTLPYTRTYSTLMALWGLVEAKRVPAVAERIGERYDSNITNAIMWLLRTRDEKLGWVPNPDRQPQKETFSGLTAQVLFVLSRAEGDFKFLETDKIYVNAEKNFARNKDLGKRMQCSNDRIHDADQSFPPTAYVSEASTMLWFPWAFAELTHLSTDDSLTAEEQAAAVKLRKEIVRSNIDELGRFVESEYMYVLGENLFCLSTSIKDLPPEAASEKIGG